MDKVRAVFHPIISSIQKMALYETKSVSDQIKSDMNFIYWIDMIKMRFV